MTDAQDLDTLLAAPATTLQVAGKTLTINRIRMRQLPRVLELVLPMKDLLMKSKPNGQAKHLQKASNFDIPTLMMKHGNDLVQLIAEIQAHGNEGVDADWVADLEIDEMINLTSKVLEINLDFFILRVVPSLSQALAGLNAGIQTKFLAGMTPLASLLPQGTTEKS